MSGRLSGRLYGVGVGPGDPELVTVKAQRLISSADVIAYPTARNKQPIARGTVDPYLRGDQIELPMEYPVTVESTDHPEGYAGALRDYYDESAVEIAAHLDAGRDVVVLCGGDPFLYGSYMYLHERLSDRYETEVVPGIPAFAAASAAAGRPLAQGNEVLSIIPGTLPPADLRARLHSADVAVVMKLGRTFERVVDALGEAGLADGSVYVERASHPDGEKVLPLNEVEGGVPYMSIVLAPTGARAARTGGSGVVTVVGLGPAGPEWLTPEARGALAAAEHIVGYQTYVDRVPVRAGQERHSSDNRVEADRARHALELAAGGARVAVVSSGDPGIFAMATAVLEQLEAGNGQFAEVDVRVVPGLSAMQAAASRVGAPLGHDFAVISLSDIRKPWDVVEKRLDAAAAADLAIALYNPASKTRREQLTAAREVLLRHRAPETPVVLARDVGGDGENVEVTTLGDLPLEQVDMRTLLVIGSSQTRVLDGGQVYTPRTYPG
ncbi:MAG: precorrin-3B C(17)-methyltransferase [Solirubrobacteraceae bacterium]|nr:precorrin-3B C(17)-methyltransferase [Solirubrobacteraceae bacterium]